MTKSKKRRRASLRLNTIATCKTISTPCSDNDTETADIVVDTPPILSEELQIELTKHTDDQILSHTKAKKPKKNNEKMPSRIVEKAVQISKAKMKKLDQLAAQKRKQIQREKLFESLKKTELSKEKLQLLYSSSKIGQAETLRERLQRSIRKQKLGCQLSNEDKSLLFRRSGMDPDQAERNIAELIEVSNNVSDEGLAGQNDDKEGRKVPVEKNQGKSSKKSDRMSSYTIISAELDTNEVAIPASLSNNEECVSSTQMSTTSENGAMARLLELRKKNEERRRNKLNVKSDIKADSCEESKYVPTPIHLSTTRELLEESQKYPSIKCQKRYVSVERKEDFQIARMRLPVCSQEQEIMELITANEVVILCGETGSGKTTQVPQFLYEAGFGCPEHPEHPGRIGVTQPRRVATISTAKRVAEELNVGFGSALNAHVGYQIRYDSTHLSSSTRIKFMTDGILLKEIQQDFLLRQYSVIILDEAHERNINTDILIGLLSRIVPFRSKLAVEELDAFNALSESEKNKQGGLAHVLRPLKLVIMSATLRVEDITENRTLFPISPPVLRVEARQYPVTIHFNKVTPLEDYVEAAYVKIARMHRKLPEGGILVFLTGQREIMDLVRKLHRNFGSKKSCSRGSQSFKANYCRQNQEGSKSLEVLEHDDIEELADTEEALLYGEEEDISYDETEDESDMAVEAENEATASTALPYIHALPLYALLPTQVQMKVFSPAPERHRLVVVATDIAETSITIPGIKYVVDVGRTKNRVYDLQTGISSFQIQWISKASADQRAGRAGRTGPGHCYRLYSSAVFDTEFQKFSPPEILGHPIEEVVLQMKAMGIQKVLRFPFPTPPDRKAFEKATKTLQHLGALTHSTTNAEVEGEITALGKRLVKFPVAARFAKMLLLGQKLNVLEYTIAIVAGLSMHSPFIIPTHSDTDVNELKCDDNEKEWRKSDIIRRRVQYMHPDSDVLSILRAAGAYAYSGGTLSFCKENFLHEKVMQQILQLREQLTRIVQSLDTNDKLPKIAVSRNLLPPSHETKLTLRQIIMAGFLDKIARRIPMNVIQEGTPFERCCAYQTSDGDIQEPVYIHFHSHVFKADPKKLSEYVVYQETFRTSRVYMKNVTVIEASWLASIALHSSHCSYSSPLEDPKPAYNDQSDRMECYVKPFYGAHQWPLPILRVPFPDTVASDRCLKYRYVAKALLEGQIIECMRDYVKTLKHSTAVLFRQQYNAKIQALPLALQQSEVDSRTALYRKWFTQREGNFLKNELMEWFDVETAKHLARDWSIVLKKSKAFLQRQGIS